MGWPELIYILISDRCLTVILMAGGFWKKLWLQDAKPWTQMQMKQKVFISADVSSLEGCAMQWISQEEGSVRQSMSLVCSSMTGV